MRIPTFLAAVIVAFAATAQSLYNEPTAQQVTRLIGAVQEAGGVSGAYTAAVARTEKSLYGNARPTYSQVETLIEAVRGSGAGGSEAAATNSAQIAELSGAVSANSAKISELGTGVQANAAAIAALETGVRTNAASIVALSGDVQTNVVHKGDDIASPLVIRKDSKTTLTVRTTGIERYTQAGSASSKLNWAFPDSTGKLATVDDISALETATGGALEGKVPTTRTVNGQALTNDVALTAEDIKMQSTGNTTVKLAVENRLDISFVADKFKTNQDYTPGQRVMYESKVYEFTEDKAAGNWNKNVVKELKLSDFMGGVLHDAAGTVVTSNIAANAVTGAKIADQTLQNRNFSDNSVSGGRLQANTVTGAPNDQDTSAAAGKLAYSTVGTKNLRDNAVTMDKLSPEVRTAIDATTGAVGKVQRIYNATGTDALDNKGNLYDSSVAPSYYILNVGGVGGRDYTYAYADFSNCANVMGRSTYNYSCQGYTYNFLCYDPVLGKLFNVGYWNNGWQKADLNVEVATNLNPEAGAVLPDVASVQMRGYGSFNETGTLTFTRTQMTMHEQPYDRFATTSEVATAVAAIPTPDFTTNNTVLVKLVADLMPTNAPVMSVNGKTGVVEIVAADVGAYTKAASNARFMQKGEKVRKLWAAGDGSTVDAVGTLRSTTLQSSKWVASRTGYSDMVYTYIGFVSADNAYVWAYDPTSRWRRIRYNPDTGSIVYVDTRDNVIGWGTQDTGMDPANEMCELQSVYGALTEKDVASSWRDFTFHPKQATESVPYDRFATTSEVAVAVAPLAETNWVMQTVSAAIAGADSRPARIYNEPGTDALDDKGQLFKSAVVPSSYELSSGGTTYQFAYVGFSNCRDIMGRDTYNYKQSNAYICYDPVLGKMFNVGYWSDSWRKQELNLEVATGLDPRAGDVLPGGESVRIRSESYPSFDTTGSLSFTPTQSTLDTSPYARFALEAMPTEWASNTTYTVGVCASSDGTAYRCKAEHTSGSTFDASKWDEIPVLSEKASRAELADAVAQIHEATNGLQRALVVLDYGEANAWAKFQEALTNNAIVFCRAEDGSNKMARYAVLSYYNPDAGTEAEFTYLRRVSSRSLDKQSDESFGYKLSPQGVWSKSSTPISMPVKAGAGITVAKDGGWVQVSSDVVGALSGNMYDFSLDADRAKALADIVRALGGSVTNDVAAAGEGE